MKIRKRKGDARRKDYSAENWEELLDRDSSAKHSVASSDAAPVSSEDLAGSAIVISVSSGRCRVFFHERELDCVIPPEIAVRQKSMLTVGDRVRLVEDGGVSTVAEVLPRHSVLARPDPLHAHRLRLVAAN